MIKKIYVLTVKDSNISRGYDDLSSESIYCYETMEELDNAFHAKRKEIIDEIEENMYDDDSYVVIDNDDSFVFCESDADYCITKRTVDMYVEDKPSTVCTFNVMQHSEYEGNDILLTKSYDDFSNAKKAMMEYEEEFVSSINQMAEECGIRYKPVLKNNIENNNYACKSYMYEDGINELTMEIVTNKVQECA